MSERNTRPVDWSQVNPEIGEFLEKDTAFIAAAKRFFESSDDDQDARTSAFESARACLQDRDGVAVEDDTVVSELGEAFSYLQYDPEREQQSGREIADAIG